MSSKNQHVADLLPDVRRQARITAKSWPTVISADDLEQELYLRLLENFSEVAVRRLVEAAPESRRGLLNKMAVQVASSYRNDFELFTGNYHYGADEVRQLLKDGALILGDMLTSSERVDITQAIELVSESHKEALITKYVEEGEPDKDTVTRAIQSLTLHMNRVRSDAEAEYYSGRPGGGSTDVDHF